MTGGLRVAALQPRYDLLIIGGGITGAGILREAQRTGASVLLVEQNDFASGTSSYSSKLVHGGLRYLKTGQWRLTLESVRERQRLLREARGLVDTQPFLMPLYRGSRPGRFAMTLGLRLYDRMAGQRIARWLDARETLALEPALRRENLLGAMYYEDARTDDARLVLRLILESMADGAHAVNYARVTQLLSAQGRVTGAAVHDDVTGTTREVEARVVINATGAWAGQLAGAPRGAPHLRPLRGSHLVFAQARLPLGRAVSWMHPRDGRPVFANPWEGAIVYGTTDIDHAEGYARYPRITSEEADYLVEGLLHQFPDCGITLADAVSSYAGVRPVVATGKANPSAESRESALWTSDGLIGVTGGKLTTFRVTARQALEAAARQWPALSPGAAKPVFEAASGDTPRLRGRLGACADELEREMSAELHAVGGSVYTWAELRWAARHEHVVHLDDLLLRRTRIGLVLADGGRAILPGLREICRVELGWSATRCDQEEARYLELWKTRHAPEVPAA